MKLQWKTVHTHLGYDIQTLSPAQFDFGHRINDPAFLPDYKRFETVGAAVEAIDKRIQK